MDLVESGGGPSDPGARHPWETARLEVVRRLIARHAPLRDGAVVIDIGCGDAFVVSTLAAAFPSAEFYGVDSQLTTHAADAIVRRMARPNLHLCHSLDAVTPGAGRAARLVLLMDVIEHVEQDGAFLDDLVARDIVDRETCVLVTVPAYPSLFSAHDVFLRHYRRYTARTLRRRLDASGLRVVEQGYFFLSLLPLRLLAVLKERLFGRPITAATAVMTTYGRVRSAALTRVLLADASAGMRLSRLGVTVPGLSAYAICRKSA
jgi:hypothetical protein